jgi:hypothetical protein
MLDGLVEERYIEEDGMTLRLTRRGRNYIERLAEAL